MKRWLVRLYPRAWRQRYEAEFTALLEQQTLTVADVIDVLRGALDAHGVAQIDWMKEGVMRTNVAQLRIILLLAIGGVLVLRSVLRADVLLGVVDLVGVAGVVCALLGWWGAARHRAQQRLNLLP
jgi:hypothetical protein